MLGFSIFQRFPDIKNGLLGISVKWVGFYFANNSFSIDPVNRNSLLIGAGIKLNALQLFNFRANVYAGKSVKGSEIFTLREFSVGIDLLRWQRLGFEFFMKTFSEYDRRKDMFGHKRKKTSTRN